MMTRPEIRAMSAMVLAFVASPLAARADYLRATENQITSSSASDDVTPRLGSDGGQGFVVYCERPILGGGDHGAGSIWLQTLNADGSATAVAPILISQGGTDDQLPDTSAARVVYTAFDAPGSLIGVVMLHDLTDDSGRALMVMHDFVGEAVIHGDRVLWIQGAVGAEEVMYLDLTWADQTPRQIGGGTYPVSNVAIGSRYAAWDLWSGISFEIAAYDLLLGFGANVTDDASLFHMSPATSGDFIVWEAYDPGTDLSSIYARDMSNSGGSPYELLSFTASAATTIRPSIDGDFVGADSDAAGNLDIVLHAISRGEEFSVTTQTDSQQTSDVMGDLVAFADHRDGNWNIFVSQFEVSPCFSDIDGDTICDDVDNCPSTPNLDQLDGNGNGVGDACEVALPGPVIVHVRSISADEIEVDFHEALDPTTAETVTNYTYDGSTSPISATLSVSAPWRVLLNGAGAFSGPTSLDAIGVENPAGGTSDSAARFYPGFTGLDVAQQDDATGSPSMEAGAFFTTSGIVVNDGFNVWTAQIYEPQEGGITIYDGTAAAAVAIGDRAVVSGVINNFNGFTEIGTGNDTTRIDVTAASLETPELIMDVPSFLAAPESFEGLLIGFESLSPVAGEIWPSAGVSRVVLMEDGSGNRINLWVNHNTDIDDSVEPVWPASVIGIGGQFDTSSPYFDGHQLMPRSHADFGVASCSCAAMNVSSHWCTRPSDTCVIVGCDVGWDDCDRAEDNGCEADLLNDEATCGDCVNACLPAQSCVSGGCEGGATDGGSASDGGPGTDGGNADGNAADGGGVGGGDADGAPSFDGGPTSDSDPLGDPGVAHDGGVVMDGGSSRDGGPVGDPGNAGDSLARLGDPGSPPDDLGPDEGCGCRGESGTDWPWLGAGLTMILFRRRRHSRPDC